MAVGGAYAKQGGKSGPYVPTTGKSAGKGVNYGTNPPTVGSSGGTAGKPGAAPKPGSPGPAGGYNSPLYDPSQTLTGKPLDQAATAIANAQTQGPISELAAQIAAQNRQAAGASRDVLGYYMQLAQAAKDAVGRDSTLGAGLNTALGNVASGTQTQLGQLGQNATGGALARMSALGLDAGQTQALQNETARQQGIGTLNAQTFQNAGLLQNANFADNASNNRGVDALAGTEGIERIGQATRAAEQPLNQKIAALDASKGALKATALGQLRQAERTYQIAEQGLGSKTAALKLAAAQDLAKNAIANRSITSANNRARATDRLRNRGYNIQQQNNLANQSLRAVSNVISAAKAAAAAAAAAGKARNPLTVHESSTITQGITAAQSILKQYQGMSPSQLNELLTTGSLPGVKNTVTGKVFTLHVPKVAGGNLGAIARAAHDLQTKHYLTAGTVRALNALGYRVGNSFPTSAPPSFIAPGTKVPGASGPQLTH